MSERPKVLAVGNINVDLAFYLEKNPEPDSEAVAQDFVSTNGGSASNFAVGVARLGIRSGMVGCVGGDQFGEEALRALRGEGVSVDLVRVLEGERTGTVCVLVESSGKRMMVAYRGANSRLEEAVAGMCRELPSVLQISNVSRRLLKIILGRVRDGGKRALVSLDPGGSSRELSVEDLHGVGALLLNEKECVLITKNRLEQGAEILAGVVETVAVKRGAKGCLLMTKGEREELPAFRVEVEDTTGAGDAFDAGFIAGIVSGNSVREAARWGSAMAAMKIRRKGAWSGLPTKERLMEFLRDNSP